ncbi:MAG: sigma-70 family RNA polymerase sigma factor [Planctomycetes bacterium]|nr:sigma-70 family RNA polymerase sigma factor [Planctomycetota bacterium]
MQPEPEGTPAAKPDDTLLLIGRHRAGDPLALQDLFDRYYERVFRLVRVDLGGNPIPGREIADVVQDVFLRVVEGIDSYEPRPGLHWISWVATLARNQIRNQRRDARAGRRGGGVRPTALHTASGSWLQVEAHITGVVSAAVAREDAERIDACVPRLAEDHRQVVLSRDYEGLDWAAIAERMGRSPEACQQLHTRARLELLRMLRGG